MMLAISLSSVGRSRPAVAGWWSSGALYAADYLNDRYMVSGSETDFATATGFTRSTVAYARNLAGTVSQFAINAAGLTDKGLLSQAALTRLNVDPATPNNWNSIIGGTAKAALPADGVWNPVTITNGTNANSGYSPTEFTITNATPVWIMARYAAGTSGKCQLVVSSAAASNALSGTNGNAGALATVYQSLGTVSDVFNRDLGSGLYETGFLFTPNSTRADARMRLGPFGTSGQTLIAYGAQAVTDIGEGRPPEWVLGTSPQGADALVLKLPSGSPLVVIRTDNNGGVFYEHNVSGDYAADPTDLGGNYITYDEARTFIMFNGDSYVGGAVPTPAWGQAYDYNIAVGGTTPYEQKLVQDAITDAYTFPTIWVDGGPSGYVDVATYQAFWDGRITAFGSTPVVIGTPMPRYNLATGVNTDMATVRDYMAATYPTKFLDYRNVPSIMAGDGSANDLADIAAGFVPRSSFHDGVHLTPTLSADYEAYALQLLAAQ